MIGQIIAFKPRSSGGGNQLNYLAGEAHAPRFGDYHAKDALGVWRMGEGLEALGLSTLEPFDSEATRRLAEGFHAKSGAALCRNAGAHHRQGWDITIDDPKDFSLIHAFGDEAAKRDYYEARREAWKIVIGEIERLAKPKFAGHEGPVKIAMEVFEHDDSRAGDPHKHGHGFLFNVGALPNGKTCAIDVSLIMASKAYLGQVYQSELARQFAKRGRAVAFEDRESTDKRKKTRYATATIPGIATPKQIEGFSERAADIAKSLESTGSAKTVKAKNTAAIKTRDAKTLSREELVAGWEAKAKKLGLDIGQLNRALDGPAAVSLTVDERHTRLMAEIDELKKKAVDGTGVINEHEVAFAAARALRGQSLEVIQQAAAFIEKTLVPYETNRLGKVFTTKECLELEARIIRQFAELSKAAPTIAIDQSAVDAASLIWESKTGHKLTVEQRAAASHIVCGPGRLANIEGEAGTGKSTLMEVAAAAWKANGLRVIGAAPTGKAAEALAMSLGDAQTCAKLLLQLDGGKLQLDAKTVLVIDECGMLTTPTYAKLVNRVAAAGAKLVCVGDRNQLAAIGMRGGFDKAIAASPEAKLTENRRQMNALAVGGPIGKLFRQGKAAEALSKIEEQGRLKVAGSESEIIKELSSMWIADQNSPMEKMVLAELVETVGELNAAIRDARLKAGQIEKGREVVLETKEGDKFTQELSAGDKILFLQNATTQARVIDLATGQACCPKNGVAAIVLEMRQVSEDSTRMTVQTEDGRKLQFDTADYGCFTLGYAHSFHKSQGSTSTNVYAVAEGSQVADLGLAYVGATRHKNDCHMFVTEEAREAWTQRASQLADSRMVFEKMQGRPVMPAITDAQAAAQAAALVEPEGASVPSPTAQAPSLAPAVSKPVRAETIGKTADPANPRARTDGPSGTAPVPLPNAENFPTVAKALPREAKVQRPQAPAHQSTAVAANILSLDLARKIADKRARDDADGKSKGKGRSGRGSTSPLKPGHAVAFEDGQRMNMDFATAALQGDVVKMRVEFDKGADIDFIHAGSAPVHLAAINGREQSIRLLAELGADFEIPSGGHSLTPLMIAAARGHAGVCQALLECGADAFAKNSNGKRASELAEKAGQSQIAEALRQFESVFTAETDKLAKQAVKNEQIAKLNQERLELERQYAAAQQRKQDEAELKRLQEESKARAMKSPNYIKPPSLELKPRPPTPDLGLSR